MSLASISSQLLVLPALALGAPACLDAGAAGTAATDTAATDTAATDTAATELASPETSAIRAASEESAQPRAAVTPAALTAGTLDCRLEYEAFSPTFRTLPLVSFQQPMSVVETQGVVVSNGTYRLYAAANPTPPYNLSFEVGVTRVSTGRDISYLVLPAPTTGGAYLFENGVRITTVTVGGIAYDHLRTYCSLRP